MQPGTGGTPPRPPGYTEPDTPGVAVGPPGRRTLAALGGAAVYVQPIAPVPPIPLHSIWLNTTLGAFEVWNGSAWVIQGFTGTQLILAGTIAANLLVANIVVAGIVNGTEIDGATFKVLNSFGAVDILLDSGTDAIYIYADTGSAVQGALLTAIAAKAATDPIDATGVPQGLFSQQLTLANQASAPPSFAAASVFYSSIAGRPRYKSSAGADNVLERADINVAGFLVGNTIVLTQASAQLNYQAGEGNQSSEYEIEIDATITTGAAANALNFQLRDGGVAFGPHITIGAIAFAINSTYFIVLRARVTITNAGSLICNVTFDGGISKSANVGSESAFPVINNSMQAVGGNNITFDPTIAHTFDLAASWSATSTGQQVSTTRTKITRRN